MRQRRQEIEERKARRCALNNVLKNETVSEEMKQVAVREFQVREKGILREARKRYSPADFEKLVVIGRGAFGEVKYIIKHNNDDDDDDDNNDDNNNNLRMI